MGGAIWFVTAARVPVGTSTARSEFAVAGRRPDVHSSGMPASQSPHAGLEPLRRLARRRVRWL